MFLGSRDDAIPVDILEGDPKCLVLKDKQEQLEGEKAKGGQADVPRAQWSKWEEPWEALESSDMDLARLGLVPDRLAVMVLWSRGEWKRGVLVEGLSL